MAHVKCVSPAGWDFDRPVAVMVKVSSRGLIGADRSDFLKLAGATAHVFADAIDRCKMAKDEIPVHLIALGASEAYGFNRNGDGFKEATCKRYHDTFVKYARFYRNHENRDPAKSYGTVKVSAYNDAMRRVELMVALNNSKEAAARNGGMVADREMEKLSRGDDIAVSMACRVPFDVCSGCGNKARTRAEYCKAATCKYGGCADNLTKVADDGHILGVDNPDPLWFDISDVYKPADRVAYGHRADWLAKAAAASGVPGAQMADALGLTAPLHVCLAQDESANWSQRMQEQIKLAYGLARAEQYNNTDPNTLRAFTPSARPPLTDGQLAALGVPGTEKSASALAAMADRKVLLPLGDFARWLGKSAETAAAARMLPAVFNRLVESGCLESRLLYSNFAFSEKAASLNHQNMARTLDRSHSLTVDAVRERAMRSSLRNESMPDLKSGFWDGKVAADQAGATNATKLAEDYALYQLAALHRMASFDRDFELTARLAIGQNKVS